MNEQVAEHLAVEEVVRCSSIGEAAEAMADFSSNGRAVYPLGGGTAIEVGMPVSRPGVLLDVAGLDAVDDYPSEDMTITVGAGVPIAELARILAEKNQALPIDFSHPEAATLGGSIAVNQSGPRRYRNGTLRDYLIGIDAVFADGKRVHGGGRVVKNVAGYDFMKMHTGALGTLGVVVQATLKVRPIPESRAAVIAPLFDQDLAPALNALAVSSTRPVAIELLTGAELFRLAENDLGAATPWGMALFFEESDKAVRWQLRRWGDEIKPLGIHASPPIEGERYDALLSMLTAWPTAPRWSVVARAAVLPSRTAEFCLEASRLLPTVRCHAHAGNGIVHLALEDVEHGEWLAALAKFEPLARRCTGSIIVPRCPVDWKDPAWLWGPPRPDWKLMRELKDKLDPTNVLNPGRFPPVLAPVHTA